MSRVADEIEGGKAGHNQQGGRFAKTGAGTFEFDKQMHAYPTRKPTS